MLHITNSLTRTKEAFVPLTPGRVRMYVCGMTVYDLCHLGHARVFVVFDMVTRWLRASGFQVEYVRNITDIDDKIIRRAQENKETPAALTGRFIAAMHEDERALGVLPPDHEPRATEYVAQMLALIGQLIANGLAYPAPNGDVYYSVRGFPAYGRLSGKSLDELRAGERVEVDPNKRDPMDFVLWKAAKPGEPAWDSPWGPGRPGWHIECSAMSEAYLGETFDIHGGGADLIFPHHENEVAQSVCAHGGAPFVRYWVHNGWVMVEGEKMSKSLGNFFTVRDLLGEHPGEAIRLTLLSAHYRQPLDFTKDLLAQSKQALDRFYLALRDQPEADVDPELPAPVEAALDDDLNTPAAIAALHDLTTRLNKARDHEKPGLAAALRAAGDLLGLLDADPEGWLRGEGTATVGGPTPEEIEDLIVRRREARKAKDFAEADRIRDSLAAQGVLLEDSPQGTTWRRS